MRTGILRLNTRHYLALAVTLGSPGAALAQAPPASTTIAVPAAPVSEASTLTAEEAVALAVRQNPRLSAVARDIVAARRGVNSARALTNPSVTFTPGLTSSAGSDEELLVTQPLELNGTRSARTGVANAQLRRTQAQAVVELRSLVLETKNAYYDLARFQELQALAQDVLRTAEEFHRGVRRQAEEGLRPQIDPVQTEIELNRARQQVTLVNSQVGTAQAALNTLLGRAPGEPVRAQSLLTSAIAAPVSEGAPAIDRAALLSQALEARAEITAEAAQREAFLQEARLARAEGRPDLAPQFRAGSITRGVQQTGVGLGITLPFLDYGSRRNRIRQAEASAAAQSARVEATRNQVRQEVSQALTRLEAAALIVQQYRQGVLDQARRLLEASLRALQLGAPGASILTVLEAQRTYRGVVTEYTTALANHAQAQAELERATGAVPATLLPPATPESRTSK